MFATLITEHDLIENLTNSTCSSELQTRLGSSVIMHLPNSYTFDLEKESELLAKIQFGLVNYKVKYQIIYSEKKPVSFVKNTVIL